MRRLLCICWGALLCSLLKHPVPAEGVIRTSIEKLGFTREDILAAARHWNVTEEVRDGVLYWRKPDVLLLAPNWNFTPNRPRVISRRDRRNELLGIVAMPSGAA